MDDALRCKGRVGEVVVWRVDERDEGRRGVK